jgi:polyisoprenoid-binding protein YceI
MNTPTTMRKYFIASFLLLSFIMVPALQAQTAYTVSSKLESMTLYGTSTLHNWTMTSTAYTGNAQFTLTADNHLTALNGLNIDLPVHNLKSESDGMTSNAYDALKADKFKDIVFKLTSATITPSGGNKYQIAALGNLTISGANKAVTLNTTALVNADGSISCSGTVALKFSDFNIERPSFMFGTMSVGDALTLNYSLIFVK